MTTGLFENRTRSHKGPSPGYIAARRQQGRATLNRFAEALAETGHVVTSARMAGVSHQRGYQLFRQIKLELGEQAC